MNTTQTTQLKDMLDEAYNGIRFGNMRLNFNRLVDELNLFITGFSQAEVKEWIQPLCLEHPIRALIHLDPYTLRSFSKPRGYSGDAGLIDFIYGVASPELATPVIGTEIFAQCMVTMSCCSVRHRRYFLAQYIDNYAETSVNPIKIMSLACGHLREANSSHALANGKAHIKGFDMDTTTIEAARLSCSGLSVDIEYGSVRQALTQTLTSETFDIVYSAGLYDYLNDKTAKRLTSRLYDRVSPGGRLLIANFLPGNRERGYMETYMDWYLNYRTQNQFKECLEEIPELKSLEHRLFTDPEGYIVYCEVVKGN